MFRFFELKPFRNLILLILFLHLNEQRTLASCFSRTLQFLEKAVDQCYSITSEEKEFAQVNITKGLHILDKILTNQDLTIDTVEDRLKEIVSVNWALYHLAVEQHHGSGFEQGSFAIEDPDFRLYQFFFDMVEFNQAFIRPSSHHSELRKLLHIDHYGIDILGLYTPGETDWKPAPASTNWRRWIDPSFSQANLLPTRKGHILFGKLPADDPNQNEKITHFTSNYTFLKMEDYGLQTWYGYYKHALGLINSQYHQYTYGDSTRWGEISRRERLDKDIQLAYQKFLKIFLNELSREPTTKVAAEVPAKVKEELIFALQEAPKLGIRRMLKEVHHIINNTDIIKAFPELEKTTNEFLNTILAKGYDSVENRTGSEIIFNLEELKARVHSNLRCLKLSVSL